MDYIETFCLSDVVLVLLVLVVVLGMVAATVSGFGGFDENAGHGKLALFFSFCVSAFKLVTLIVFVAAECTRAEMRGGRFDAPVRRAGAGD